MRAILRFFITFAGLVSMTGCTNGMLDLSSLGLTGGTFTLMQGGQSTTAIKVNNLTQQTSFTVTCPRSDNALMVSFDNGKTFEQMTSLSCANGQTDVSFNLSSSKVLSDPTQPVMPALVHAAGASDATKDVAVNFVHPVYNPTITASIEHGASITNKLSVTIDVSVSQTAGPFTFAPARAYTTPAANCDMNGVGGAWQNYKPTLTGATLDIPNGIAYARVFFEDEVGNDSACTTATIQTDTTAPVATSFAINSNAAQTATAAVTVNMGLDLSDVATMKLFMNAGCAGTAFFSGPAALTQSATLAGGGTNNISGLFYDAAGNASICYSDSIIYNTTPPNPPTGLTLTTALGVDHQNPVNITVAGVTGGDTVNVYADSDCAISVGTATATGSSAVVPVSLFTDGTYTFYAKTTSTTSLSSICTAASTPVKSVAYDYNGTKPVVTKVTSLSTLADYPTGSTIDVEVFFSKDITVTTSPAPSLLLKFDTSQGTAIYNSVDHAGHSIKFTYTVTSNDVSPKVDALSASALQVPVGASIRDDHGNDATTTLALDPNTASLPQNQIVKVNYIPRIVSISAQAGGDYFTNDQLDFVVTWSAPVQIAGSPVLALSIGGVTYPTAGLPTATFASDPLRNVVASRQTVFTGKLVSPMDSTSGPVSPQSITLSSGSISNIYGDAAILTVPATTFPSVVVHNSAAPTIYFSTSNVSSAVASHREVTVSENNLSTSFSISSSPVVTTGSIVVTYTVMPEVNNSASRTNLSALTFTATLDSTHQIVTVPLSTLNDSVIEGAGAVNVSITSVSYGRLGIVTNRRFVITDDDATDAVVEMASGAQHACARYSNGRVSCWGSNFSGQLGQFSPTNAFAPMNIGSPYLSGSGVTRIFAGGNTSCALISTSLYCWGSNNSGLLGNGAADTLVHATPTLVPGMTDVIDVSMNDQVICAIFDSSNRYLTCWGNDSNYGMLGNNTNKAGPLRTSPLLSGVRKISVGGTHACVLMPATFSVYLTVECWGSNSNGQLGTNSAYGTSSASPTYIYSDGPGAIPGTNFYNSGEAFTDVKAGTSSTCVLTNAKNVYCFGAANYNGSTTQTNVLPSDSTKVAVATSINVLSAASSALGTVNGYFCGQNSSNQLLCWGSSNRALLPDNSATPKGLVPTTTASIVWSSPAVFALSFARFCMSSGSAGAGIQCANTFFSGTAEDPFADRYYNRMAYVIPNTFTDVSPTSTISNSQSNFCTLNNDKSVSCGGNAAWVGDGSASNRTFTTKVFNAAAGVKKISTGANVNCAILGDKTLWCWGGVPATGSLTTAGIGVGTSSATLYLPSYVMSDVVDVNVAQDATCAVTSVGALYCWGMNLFGTVGDGTQLPVLRPKQILTSGVTSLSIGFSHACVIQNAAMYCWGANGSGQLGNASVTASYTPSAVLMSDALVPKTVTTGALHTCALYTNGDVRCWGEGSSGQLGRGVYSEVSVPVSYVLHNATQVTAFGNTTCALTASNDLNCWGMLGPASQGLVTATATPIILQSGIASFRAWATSISGYLPSIVITSTTGSKAIIGLGAPGLTTIHNQSDSYFSWLLGL